MELLDPSNPLRSRRKERCPEMPLALLLTKAASWNQAYTGSLQEPLAVVLIRLLAQFQGLNNSLLWECDRGEEIHGSLWLLALDALHLLEGFVEREGTGAEAGVDAVEFGLVELVGFVALLRWGNHQINEALTDDGRAEIDGDELIDLSANFGGEAHELKIASAVATLAYHTLGNGMEGNKLDMLVLSGLSGLQLPKNPLEGDEFTDKDVGLVDFVGHDDKAVLAGETEDGLNGILGERSTGGISGIDNSNAAHVCSQGLRLDDGLLNAGDVCRPGGLFFEVIWDGGSAEEGESSGIKRVLGDGN